jgi:hypothetical protein
MEKKTKKKKSLLVARLVLASHIPAFHARVVQVYRFDVLFSCSRRNLHVVLVRLEIR